MTTIVTKNGSGAPLASDLVQGELAVDLTNKRLYTEDSGGSVIELGSNPTSLTTGTFTSTGIDDNATSTAITIDSSENVGIGTSSPSRKLQVEASDPIVGTIVSTTTGAGIGFKDATTTADNINTIRAIGQDLSIRGANNTIFLTNNLERMRIDSSGNVGIGTSSPGAPLQIGGASAGDAALWFNTSGTSYSEIEAVTFGFNYNMPLVLQRQGGNVGIGRTPVSHYSGYTAIDLGASATIWSNRTTADTNISGLANNAYFDGTNWTYKNTDEVTSYSQANGGHFWYNAPSGTAGTTVTLTERMRIDSSGYLINPTAYNATTGSAANMHVLSSGAFIRSVSSIKYKTGVEDAWLDYAKKLYDLRPVYYKSLGEFDNPDWSHWGFIAEEVAEVDPRLAHFKTTETSLDENGERVETQLAEPEVEGVQYDRMVPLLLMLMKEQKEQIETLQAEVAALKGA